MLEFPASLWSVKTDHDGESTITFRVPLSALAVVPKLGQCIGQLLTVQVEIAHE